MESPILATEALPVAADTTFAVVPTWVLSAPSRAVHLYALLRRYADASGQAWPSRTTLAERLGCSVDSVDRALRCLVEIGAVTVVKRWGEDGSPLSNLYRLHSQPVGKPVEEAGGVAATVRPGSRTTAAGVAAPVRHERKPLNDKNPPTPPQADDGPTFEEFWDLWPRHHRKRDRATAQRLWSRLTTDERKQTLSALALDKQSRQWTRNDGEFIPGPVPWLRKQPWEAVTDLIADTPPSRSAFVMDWGTVPEWTPPKETASR